MKKISMLLPVLLAVGMSVFAAPFNKGEEELAKASFNRHFAGAENVTWSAAGDEYQKASFVWAGQRAEAYFGKEGKFVGAIRGLFYQQLPLAVIRTIDQKFEKRVVLEVREITNEEGTFYSVLMNWKNKRYRVRLMADGGVVESGVVRK